RTGSYTAAGPVLGLNRTTVGRRIDSLETALGMSLFRDSPAGPEPTPEGRILLESATRIEAEIERMGSLLRIQAEAPTHVRIASSAGIAVEFLLEIAEFQADRTDVGIELLGALDPLEAVTQRRADL